MATGILSFGDVRVGTDATLADLSRDYAPVFLATFADSRATQCEVALAQHPDGARRDGAVLADGSLVSGDYSAVRSVSDGRRALLDRLRPVPISSRKP
jgi:hypothetical protein